MHNSSYTVFVNQLHSKNSFVWVSQQNKCRTWSVGDLFTFNLSTWRHAVFFFFFSLSGNFISFYRPSLSSLLIHLSFVVPKSLHSWSSHQQSCALCQGEALAGYSVKKLQNIYIYTYHEKKYYRTNASLKGYIHFTLQKRKQHNTRLDV